MLTICWGPLFYCVRVYSPLNALSVVLPDAVPRYVPISSGLSWNIDGLLEAIWADLGLVRVYTKPKGEIPDLDEPVILKGTPLLLLLAPVFQLVCRIRFVFALLCSLCCLSHMFCPSLFTACLVSAENPPSRRTVEAFCNRLHKSIAKDLKFAVVWGRSAKFNPQKVGLSHLLADEDVIQLVKQVGT